MTLVVARRYWPVATAAVVCAVVAALFPSVEARTHAARLRSGALGQVAPESHTATSDTAVGENTSASLAAGGSPAGSGGSSARPAAPNAASAITPPSSVGVARSGVRCGPGVRQVPWSFYAPACVAAYHGNNGGATSHGVTGNEIVLSYRRGNSAQDAAIYSAVGDATPGSDDDIVTILRTYVDLFNRTYELYGRHVVLKDFQGQGDWAVEDSGQGQPQAEADAASAHDEGAFADVTGYKGSPFYWSGLAQQKVITFCCFGYPRAWFARNAPYWYSLWLPSGTTEADLLASVVCRRMAGLPATFAGDPALQQRTRTIGFVGPDDNPQWSEADDYVESTLARCGTRFAKRVSYSVNFAQMQSEATSIVAQMHNAGVTTVICWCDPLLPIFLSQSADQQQYRPEWIEPDWPEPAPRLYQSDQWSHALSFAHQWGPRGGREAYDAFKLASGGSDPREQYFDYHYQILLQLFAGLQAAGPDLNPSSFQRGLRSLSSSGRGEFGTWNFATSDGFAPYRESQLSWWNPGATSAFDGKAGAWQPCESGAWLPFDDPAAGGPARTQLHCFGR